jgi:DNA-binding transcriptional ArsR family regulator
MDQNKILELEKRRRIYNFILKNPGLHLREISRRTKIPKSTLRYHLIYLKKRDLIIEKLPDRYRRYYGINKLSPHKKNILVLLRNKTIRHIVLILSMQIITSKIQISKILSKHPNTIKAYLKKLEYIGVIEPAEVKDGEVFSPFTKMKVIESSPVGREIFYRIKEPEVLWEILSTYQRSFLDDVTNEIINDIRRIRKGKILKKGKTVNWWIDFTIEKCFEIFPHPYHA